MRVRIEQRSEPLTSWWASAALIGVALILGMALAGLLFIPFGASPIEGYSILISNAFLSLRGFGFTLVAATPLMFVAFGTIVAWRCGFMFLGFEGCLLIGAMGAAMVALAAVDGAVLAHFPPLILIALALIWGAVLGAIWSGIVGELKVRLDGNEILIALMMNFLAIYLIQYLVVGPWRVDGDLPQTIRFRRDMWLPYILPGTRLHAGILIALAVGAVLIVLLNRTRAGFEMLAAGLNETAAKYGGINAAVRRRQAACLAGALAGLGGAVVVLGVHHRLLDGLSDGTGFLGIVAALLGRMSILGSAIASILYGGLSIGGDAMQRQTGLPSSIVVVVQATIVLFLLAFEFLRTHRVVVAAPKASSTSTKDV